jgi:hypothetical protein
MPTKEQLQEVVKQSMSDADRMIDDNLRDPDLASQSEEWKAGYRKGFREALAGFVSKMIKDRFGERVG